MGMNETKVRALLGPPTRDSTKRYKAGTLITYPACRPVPERIVVLAGYQEWQGDQFIVYVWLDARRCVADTSLSRIAKFAATQIGP